MSRSDHKGNKIKNSHIQTKRVYILRHSIDAKNVEKIACITTNVHEIKQKNIVSMENEFIEYICV